MKRFFTIRHALAVLPILLAVIVGAVVFLQPDTEPAQEPAEEPEQTGSNRPAYHFSSPDKWKNDPQKPVYHNGKYHYYYLYNGDYPDGNGTEWRHATSEDLVNWKDEGVAIPKYTNDNGDPWSGSVVVDENNTAGFGEDAFIAIVTQPTGDSGAQEQYLWYSTDGGTTFESMEEPVLENPGVEDYRDPKIIRDEERDTWVMLLAEGDKIGFYTSDNLKDWEFVSDFQTDGLGVLECPDLFRMRAADGTEKWVLGMSANGQGEGEPNTYAYWTGEFDGTSFSPDEESPKWLDYGFDWYGAVTFEDGEGDPLERRYAIAWMNNWAYADQTPTMESDGFNGTDSIVREVRLQGADEGYSLVSKPVSALDERVVSGFEREEVVVEDGAELLDVEAETYRLDARVSWEDVENVGLRLRESADGERHVDVGFLPGEGVSYVNRGFADQPDESGEMTESRAPFESDGSGVDVTVLVDRTSVEVFVGDGSVVHSSLVFPREDDQGVSLFADGGGAVFEDVRVSALR